MRARLAIALAIATVACALAPTTAGAAERHVKTVGPGGRVPGRWDLAKPKARAHPDVAPRTASGSGDGSNNVTFASFDSGDIVVVLGSGAGHAGVFDGAMYGGLYSYAVLSANTSPRNGVQWESCVKYRAFPEAYGLWVPSRDWCGSSVRYYCRAQLGEPYNILSSKSDETAWYCSKLAWAGWRRRAAADLDGDGGYWVWPVDLITAPLTSVFGHWI